MHRRDSTIFLPNMAATWRSKYLSSTYVELPGADALYWVGDTAEFSTRSRNSSPACAGALGRPSGGYDLFTDIVGSTERAANLGDDRWRDLLDHHDNIIRGHSSASVAGKSTPSATDFWRSSQPECDDRLCGSDCLRDAPIGDRDPCRYPHW